MDLSRRCSKRRRIKKQSRRIPEELVSEILSRLPARSVIRFRYVCKLWRSLTQDPFFIDAHIDLARKANPPSILLFISGYWWDRYGIAISDENSRSGPKRILWGPKPQCSNFVLGNSCNGLLCIYGGSAGERIKVINPATAESLTLPKNKKTDGKNCWGAFLGFHPQTKEYKVIRFFALRNVWPVQIGCQVHTLGTNKWRQISVPDPYSFPWHLCHLPVPAIVKGVVYWLIKGYHWKHSLLSFDLKSESCTRISLPDTQINKREEYHEYCHLVELQGSVCLTVSFNSINSKDPQHIDLWMLMLNTDDHNNTTYEWALKYSLCLPIAEGLRPMPLLMHDEKILVHTSDLFFRPAQLIYYHINSKGKGKKEVFYRKGKPASLPICYYLKGQYTMDEDLFRWIEVCQKCQPFVHIESLVQLRHK